MNFKWQGLAKLSISFKVFISLILCVSGLSYLMLLASIWFDTGLSIPVMIEGYGTFENSELVEHSFRYLFWFTGTFIAIVPIFLITRASETLKIVVAVAVPLLIVSDIVSAWLIRFADTFAWVMASSGFALAFFFLGMFVIVQRELWGWGKKDRPTL